MHMNRSIRSAGFLAKTNPKATLYSVFRRAGLAVLVSSALWGAARVFRFNPEFEPTWPMFILWIACAACVGAVYEWQVPEKDG
jgi:hypothetical protein